MRLKSFLFLAFLPVPVLAQGPTRRTAFHGGVGATHAVFSSRFGGGTTGVTATLGVTRHLAARWGVRLDGSAVGFGSQMAVSPQACILADLVPGSIIDCAVSMSASSLWGATAGLVRDLTPNGAWQASLGAGAFRSRGLAGPSARSAGVVEAGLRWTATRDGIAPTVGVTATRFLRGIGGSRTLVLPSVGVSW